MLNKKLAESDTKTGTLENRLFTIGPSMSFTQIFIQFFIQILEYPKNQILKFGQNSVILDIFNDFFSKF